MIDIAMRTIQSTIATLTVLCACCMLTSCQSKQETHTLKPVNVKTVAVQVSQQQVSHTYVGTVQESYGSSVSFAAMGTVRAVNVQVGQHVVKGQVLASLDATQMNNAYNMALSTLRQAEDAFKRMDELYKKGSLPEIKYVEAQTALAEARSAEQMAKKNVGDCVLRAPFAGYVSERHIDVGNNVVPGSMCFKLVKLAQIEVNVPVPEQEISNIRVGQTFAFTVAALNNREFRGRVSKKGVQANALSHTYDVTLTLANPGQALLPGMVCSVQATGGQSQRGIVVPQEAVLTDGNSRFVWLAVGGKATRRMVQTGGVTPSGVMITGGLGQGDHVIVSGQDKVSEGTIISEQ